MTEPDPTHPVIAAVTRAIEHRSRDSRAHYLASIRARLRDRRARDDVAPGNLAHAAAGCALADKRQLLGGDWPNLGIVTAYNDMLSAHQPFERFPELIRQAPRPRWRAACRRCATASPRDARAWSSRSSPGT